jgi:hypothetical protein
MRGEGMNKGGDMKEGVRVIGNERNLNILAKNG